MKTIAISGANGFVGTSLTNFFQALDIKSYLYQEIF